jgi:4-amino-4-deoxy-L-arabinose transferase-like glycosyltransferase
MGQVLQIGRLGESEALFALLVSASLLVWHLGYIRRWKRVATWTSGFAFAALAALVKGPQAPVYFGAITGAYLLLRRDWRYLLSWQCAVGAAMFAIIIAAWQLPYYLATDWAAVVATWGGLAGDRFYLRGALEHAVTYPAETFVCILPWSPILVAVAKRETRQLLRDQAQTTTFLYTALLVAYPTVWLAAGARGRYFMPLYPLVAVLVGLIVERCSSAAWKTYPRRAWHQFLLLWNCVIGAIAILFAAASILPIGLAERFYQPRLFCAMYSVLAVLSVYCLWRVYHRANKFQPTAAVFAIAAVAGFGVAGLMVNVNTARWNNPTDAVASLKHRVPDGARLVSFSPVEHRFVYYFQDSVAELDWPTKLTDAPIDTDYFCFMRHPDDTAAQRISGRGRTPYTTPGTLPFAWEEITSICVERQVYNDDPRTVVLGRIVRPLRAMVSDVTVPQSLASASTTAPNTRSTDRSRMHR